MGGKLNDFNEEVKNGCIFLESESRKNVRSTCQSNSVLIELLKGFQHAQVTMITLRLLGQIMVGESRKNKGNYTGTARQGNRNFTTSMLMSKKV